MLYMAVTADKLELPLFVADNTRELVERFNTTRNCVLSAISHKNNGKVKGYKFIRVEEVEEYGLL